MRNEVNCIYVLVSTCIYVLVSTCIYCGTGFCPVKSYILGMTISSAMELGGNGPSSAGLMFSIHHWWWLSAGTGPEMQWSLLHGSHSKPTWTQSWVTQTRGLCLSREVGLSDLQCSLPTLSILDSVIHPTRPSSLPQCAQACEYSISPPLSLGNSRGSSFAEASKWTSYACTCDVWNCCDFKGCLMLSLLELYKS